MIKQHKKLAINIIMVIIVVNIFSKILGFIRDAVFGSQFGTSIPSDAYTAALQTTTLLFLCLGTGIAATIIPIVVKLNKAPERDRVLSSIFNAVFILSIIIGIIFVIFTPQIINIFASGYTGEKFDLTVKIARIMAPSILFIALGYLYVGLLQAHEHYILPTVISIPYNVLLLGFLFLGLKEYGIIGLAVVTSLGWLLQMVIQMPKVNQVVRLKYTLQLDVKNAYVKDFLWSLFPIVFITATQQINVLSDQKFITHFGDGTVTNFYFANILFSGIVTIVVYGITAVMFPKFNKKFIEDQNSFYETLNKVLEGIILVLMPVSIGLILVSQDTVSIIFMRNKFIFEDVKTTSSLLIGYTSFMLAFGIWDVLNKAFYTIGKKVIPMIISAIIILLNYGLNILLVHYFDFNGITLATSLAFYIGIVVSLILFNKCGGRLAYKSLWITLLKTLGAVSLMALAILVVNKVLSSFMPHDTNGWRMVWVIIDIGVGMLMYFVGLILVREKNMREFTHALRIRIRRGKE